MILKPLAAKTLAASIVAVALAAFAVIAISTTPADAAKRKVRADRGTVYGSTARGPNSSYMSGPRTRIFVTKRSWLDAGTEVLPGDRKFQDYAFPPGRSFGNGNINQPLDRQPLNPDYDLGGYPQRFPLYW